VNTVNGGNGTTGVREPHVRLLLEHGVDPELHGTRRAFYDGRTSSVEAASSGGVAPTRQYTRPPRLSPGGARLLTA
jgi:hypothetical protein